MNERDETLLRDMLDAALDAKLFASGRTRETLESDRMFALALVKAIEIVGEAASKISAETREAFPQLPWKGVIGMRNKVIHDYRNVDYDIVWETVVLRIPELVQELQRILPPETGENQ